MGRTPATAARGPAAAVGSNVAGASPLGLLLGGAAAWMVIFVLTGVRYHVEVSPEAAGLLGLSILLFALGAWLAKQLATPRHAPAGRPELSAASIQRGLRWASSLAILSLPLRIAVGEPWAPSLDATTVAAARDNLDLGGVNLLEIGTPMSTFGVVAAMLLAIGWRNSSNKLRVAGVFAVVQYVSFGLAQGSRTHIVVTVACVAIAYRVAVGKPSRRMLLYIGASTLAVVFLSIWILSGRIANQNYTSSEALTYLQQSRGVKAPEAAVTLAYNTPQFAPSVYTGVSLSHYALHGVVEYLRLFEWQGLRTPPLGFGYSTFGSIASGLPTLFTGSKPFDGELYPSLGVYRTLWGSLLADFGYFGSLAASLLLGLVIGAVHARLWITNIAGRVIVYAPLGAVMLSAVFFNAIAGAYGTYTMLACIATAIYMRDEGAQPK